MLGRGSLEPYPDHSLNVSLAVEVREGRAVPQVVLEPPAQVVEPVPPATEELVETLVEKVFLVPLVPQVPTGSSSFTPFTPE